MERFLIPIMGLLIFVAFAATMIVMIDYGFEIGKYGFYSQLKKDMDNNQSIEEY